MLRIRTPRLVWANAIGTVTILSVCLLAAAAGTFAWHYFAWLEKQQRTDGMDADIEFPPLRARAILPGNVAKVSDNAAVIGISVAGKHRAFVLAALSPISWHVVNDLLGSTPVTIAYCDRTNCIRVFAAETGSEPLDVSVAGWRQVRTGSEGGMIIKTGGKRYFQASGAPLDSAQTSDLPYRTLPFVRTTWKAWKSAHPDTDVYVGGFLMERPT